MNQADTIRVLLVDDHPIFAQGLALLLRSEPNMTVIGHSHSGAEAIALFRQYQPDVTLMDLRMPDMGGVEVIEAIRTEFPTARILVLSIHDSDEWIYQAIQAGAKGFLLKDVQPAALVNAIHTVYQDQLYLPAPISEKLVRRMTAPELSEREREVLRLMAKGKNNAQISAELHVAESTVRFHTGHIFNKLGVGDRTQAVLVAIQRGIVQLW